MPKKILLDDQEFHFTPSDLPLLIHGQEGKGASLLTITVLSDLYSQGAKILALTGYPMAREAFLGQTNDRNNIGWQKGNLNELQTKKALFSTDKDFFSQLINNLPDSKERIILIKNIELFPEKIFDAVKDFNHTIISGDISKCPHKEKILQRGFTTKIFFSSLAGSGILIPSLQIYQGYLDSPSKHGIISVSS